MAPASCVITLRMIDVIGEESFAVDVGPSHPRFTGRKLIINICVYTCLFSEIQHVNGKAYVIRSVWLDGLLQTTYSCKQRSGPEPECAETPEPSLAPFP